MTNTFIPNSPPAGVTCLRTRSNNAAERATIWLAWHTGQCSLCDPCIIIPWWESKASVCFQIHLSGSLTYHRELLCISLYEKLQFDLNALKTLQGQDLKFFFGPNSGEKFTSSFSWNNSYLNFSNHTLQRSGGVAQRRWEVQLGPKLLMPIISKSRGWKDRRSQAWGCFYILSI